MIWLMLSKRNDISITSFDTFLLQKIQIKFQSSGWSRALFSCRSLASIDWNIPNIPRNIDGNIGRIPWNIANIEGNIRNIPWNNASIPRNIRRIEGSITNIPRNIGIIPVNLEKMEAGLRPLGRRLAGSPGTVSVSVGHLFCWKEIPARSGDLLLKGWKRL